MLPPQPHFAPAWPFSTLPSGLRLRVGVCLEAITELEGHRRESALHRGVVVGVAVTAGDPVRRNSRREQGRRARLAEFAARPMRRRAWRLSLAACAFARTTPAAERQLLLSVLHSAIVAGG